MSTLDTLPLEIITEICTYLRPMDIVSISTIREFRDAWCNMKCLR